MNQILHSPMVLMPPVYELPIRFWRWCRLKEVCEVARDLYNHLGINEYECTPENLVIRFAAMTRYNQVPERLSGESAEKRKKKIFRYSADGSSMWGTEVPSNCKDEYYRHPFGGKFELQIGTPYPDTLFIPEGWALDTLKLIRRGVISVQDYGTDKFAFQKDGLIILTEGVNKGKVLTRAP